MKKITLAATLVASLFAGSALATSSTGQLHFTTGNDGVQRVCSIQVTDRVGGITFGKTDVDTNVDTAAFKVMSNGNNIATTIRNDSVSDEKTLGKFKYIINGESVDASLSDVAFTSKGNDTNNTVYVQSPTKVLNVEANKVYTVDSTVTCKATL